MPAPTPVPGVTSGPPTTPATRAVRVEAKNAGSRGGGGLAPNAIRAGVNIAFGSPHNAEAPLWQLLDDLGPT